MLAATVILTTSNVQAYLTLDGGGCGDMTLKPGAFSWWEQSRYQRGMAAGTDNSRIKHHDFLVTDIYNNHLEPAISAMHTETGQGHGGSVAGNLYYTLNYIPNHPKALHVLVEYSFVIKKRPRHARLPAPPECALQRAIEYAPNDPGPYFLFGLYLHKLKKYELAVEKYNAGIELAPHSSEGIYNRGLSLVKLGRYEEAREDAIKAYALGYPLSGLRRMLKAKGYAIGNGAQAATKSDTVGRKAQAATKSAADSDVTN